MRSPRACGLAAVLLSCVLSAEAPAQSIADAQLLGQFGMRVPSYPGSLGTTIGNAVNPATGEVFVVEAVRVQVFSAAGVFLREWPCPNCRAIGVNPGTGETYVSTNNPHTVLRFSSTGAPLGTWGSAGTGPGQFRFPSGVAVDPDTGNVYVRDTQNARIQQFTASGGFIREFTAPPGIFVAAGSPGGLAFDPVARVLYTTDSFARSVSKFDADGNFLLSWTGALGSGPGQLKWLRGLAVEPASGNVYVCDTDNERISVFTPSGAFVKTFQGPHDLGAGPFHPRDIAIHPATGAKYVNAAYAFRVDRFDANDAFLASFGTRQMEGAFLEHPRGMAVSPVTGDVYLIDSGNSLAKRFSPGGGFKLQWGGSVRIDPGLPGLFGFNADSALTVDPDGNVWNGLTGIHYVDEPLTLFVQRSDPNGANLAAWPRVELTGVKYDDFITAIAVDPVTREVWLADWIFKRVRKYSPTGTPLLSFTAERPSGIAVRDGLVYIAESTLHRILVYSTGGTFVGTFGAPGAGAGQLALVESSGLSLAPDGSLLIADSGNHRIQQFTPSGQFVAQLGNGAGSQPGQFLFPSGTAWSPSGDLLYVLDTINNRVQMYCLTDLATCQNQIDSDADTVPDAFDNCPYVVNASQDDGGRVASPSNPAGAGQDAIGDPCQCGAITPNGIVDADDAALLREQLADPAVAIPAERCSVSGPETCDLRDYAVLARAFAGRNPGVKQLCSAALRVLP
jgi:DNA-binding beta-propeller fold protein YncE